MATQIYVNLPVKNLDRSVETFLQTFTPKRVSDATKATEVSARLH